jgi:hypothetical protein
MSKTGVHGAGMVAVPMLASIFGGQLSSGIMLPILCLADVMGVWYYHLLSPACFVVAFKKVVSMGSGWYGGSNSSWRIYGRWCFQNSDGRHHSH